MPVTSLLAPLAALLEPVLGYTPVLQPLADTGLAHWHVRVAGSGLLARIPKQSQMGLPASENLAYESACFSRAAASAHVPRLHCTLAAQNNLPWGALLVDEVNGGAASQPAHLPAIMHALAALHCLPLPAPAQRAPLLCETPVLQAMLQQIKAQAAYLSQPQVPLASRQAVEKILKEMTSSVPHLCRHLPLRLIAFDAHPGNFLITPQGRAILVDLEKMRYGLPPLDLAHATLYTSTTWDVNASFELSVPQVAATYQEWIEAMGSLADAYLPALLPLRTLMWLWSITWCAKWLGEYAQPRRQEVRGEDWSQENSQASLVAHVHERVTHYLATPTVERLLAEFAALHQHGY